MAKTPDTKPGANKDGAEITSLVDPAANASAPGASDQTSGAEAASTQLAEQKLPDGDKASGPGGDANASAAKADDAEQPNEPLSIADEEIAAASVLTIDVEAEITSRDRPKSLSEWLQRDIAEANAAGNHVVSGALENLHVHIGNLKNHLRFFNAEVSDDLAEVLDDLNKYL